LNWKKLFAVDFERGQKFFYFNNQLKNQKNKCFLFKWDTAFGWVALAKGKELCRRFCQWLFAERKHKMNYGFKKHL